MTYTAKESDLMNHYDESGIKKIMIGATLLASGGGGSYGDGEVLLRNFKEANPEVEIAVDVKNVYEMSDDSYGLVIAGIGAPTEQADQDFSPCVSSCYDEFARFVGPRVDKKADFVLPVEMGGFNTLVPMLAAMKYGLPVLNVDGAGRAVPTLTTTLMSMSGIASAPVVLTDANDNRISIILSDGKNDEMIENISREISEEFHANAAIGGWLMNRTEVKNIAMGTVILAGSYGEIIQYQIDCHSGEDNIGEYVADALIGAGCPGKILVRNGKVTQFSSNPGDGFDIGSYKVISTEDEENSGYRVAFKNESLILYKFEESDKESVVVTAPEIISLIDRKTGMPLTNEDLAQIYQRGELDELRVVLVIIKVDPKWNRNPEKVSVAWKKELKDLGYEGELVRL